MSNQNNVRDAYDLLQDLATEARNMNKQEDPRCATAKQIWRLMNEYKKGGLPPKARQQLETYLTSRPNKSVKGASFVIKQIEKIRAGMATVIFW